MQLILRDNWVQNSVVPPTQVAGVFERSELPGEQHELFCVELSQVCWPTLSRPTVPSLAVVIHDVSKSLYLESLIHAHVRSSGAVYLLSQVC